MDGKRLDFGVFDGSTVKNVVFPSTLKRIEYSAFNRCEDLKGIRFSDGLEYIGKRCFYESGLETVVFPPGLRSVGACAFYGCEGLRSVVLNEGLQRLGEQDTINGRIAEGSVFRGSGVQKVTFPVTLKEISDETFADCMDLKRVHLREGLEKIGICAFQRSRLESVTLPASLRVVSQGAFCNCNSLQMVKFSDGLEVLGTDEYPNADGRYFGVF